MAEVWIIEVVGPDGEGPGAPLLGYCFGTQKGAETAIRGLTGNYRAMSYFRLRREDLDWARVYLAAHVGSESLERIIEALL
jgi:hypothetical protein